MNAAQRAQAIRELDIEKRTEDARDELAERRERGLDDETEGLGPGESRETPYTRICRLASLMDKPIRDALLNDYRAGDKSEIGYRVEMWIRHG